MSSRSGRLPSGPTYVLDFAPMCKCGNQATHYLEVHAVDHCTEDKPTWVKLICKACVSTEVLRVASIVADGEEWCSTCGLSLVNLGDLIVSLVPIDNAGQR